MAPHRGIFVFAVRLWCSTGVSLFPPSGCGAPPGYLCFRRQVVVLHRGIFVYAVASACLLLVIFSRRDVARLRRADAYGCTKVPRWGNYKIYDEKKLSVGNCKTCGEKISRWKLQNLWQINIPREITKYAANKKTSCTHKV